MKTRRLAASLSFLMAITLALGFSAAGTARASDTKSALVEVSLLSPVFGVYNGYFFFRVTPTVALGIIGGYSRSSADENGVSSTGWCGGLEANWFLTGSAISSGWRIVPSIRYLSNTYSHGSGSAVDRHADFGLEGGYRWVWDNGLTLGLSAGIGYQTHGRDLTLSDGYTFVYKEFLQIATGLSPLANISFGYAF